MKAIAIGVTSSFFFAVTFVLNRMMSDAGGSWIWSASLRYLFILPILLGMVLMRKHSGTLFIEMRRHPWQWLLWSLIGFGLFYAPLCFAAAYSPAWLVAGTWQFTIVAGSLLAPLFTETITSPNGPVQVRRRIPWRGMSLSVLILIGIAVMTWTQSTHVSLSRLTLGTVPIVVAAFAYPLGNRKMMALCAGRIDAYQRTLGMTIASLPLWLVLSLVQLARHGLPSPQQTLQSLIVAVSSGIIATVLFFTATDLVRDNTHRLAAVEATQSGEVVFTLVGELLFIAGTKVSAPELVGVALVVVGMVLHSLLSATPAHPANRNLEA